MGLRSLTATEKAWKVG